MTLFSNSSNLREEIYVLSDYEFIVHQKEYIQTTEYICVFVLHRKLETNKISVRRKAESTRFGGKKRLSLTAEAVTMNQWPERKVKMILKMKNNSKTTGKNPPLPSSATELFKYYQRDDTLALSFVFPSSPQTQQI